MFEYIRLYIGQSHSLNQLLKQLTEFDYERVGELADPGQFALRGGVLDLFPATFESPLRIEFQGSKINSIRSFNPKTIESSNALILNSGWKESKISDVDLRKIYAESTISIIPLTQTYQPSGQSVALQSMSMETPVVITKTNGFWDKDMFTHQENIIFMKENNVNTWKKTLESLMNDRNNLSKIAESAKLTIVKRLNQKDLFQKFLIILNS